jgi:hypothetical protein
MTRPSAELCSRPQPLQRRLHHPIQGPPRLPPRRYQGLLLEKKNNIFLFVVYMCAKEFNSLHVMLTRVNKIKKDH